jgi:hypothetical protein
LRRIAVAPGEDSDIGLASVDHFENLGERRERARRHIFHGDHFVPELS